MRSDRGQATVELALILPVLLLVVLAGVQVAIIIRGQIAVIHAAHAGARAAALAADANAAAVAAAQSAVALGPLDVRSSTTSRAVRVDVSARVPTEVPLVGLLLGDVRVTARATMPLEE
mgnify:CR=1 FL=1